MKKYLLDSNYWIALPKENDASEDRKKILREMAKILADSDSRLILTPLIRYEVLRGVPWVSEEKLQRMENILNGFEMLEITREIADLSQKLYRFDDYETEQYKKKKENNMKQQDKQKKSLLHTLFPFIFTPHKKKDVKNVNKRNFDVFHYATAEIYELELLSNDDHIKKIKKLHQRMKDSKDKNP